MHTSNTLKTVVLLSGLAGFARRANMAMFASLFGGNNDEDAPNPAVALLLAIVAPMAAGLMQMALSRSREFEADRIGAELQRIARLLGTRRQVAA